MAETAPPLPSTVDDHDTGRPVPRELVRRESARRESVSRESVPRESAPRESGRHAPGRPPAAPRPGAPTREPLWRHVLGDQLRSLRHERRETLVETAGRAGVSPQYLSEVERGIKEPSSEMIAALAGALDVTLVDLTIAVSETLRSGAPAPAAAHVRRAPTCQAAYALAV